MKRCRRCHRPQPLSAFYMHANMADGHLNHRKRCVSTAAKVCAAHPDRVAARRAKAQERNNRRSRMR
jgi:hypothetical protein